MQILAHRGFWHKEDEKNTEVSLKRALDEGYGFESDIRDYRGLLVISHDIASEKSIDAEDVFAWLKDHEDKRIFAINIKADGLNVLLKDVLSTYHIHNYFCFDMSLPQLLEYTKAGLRCFTRQSEYETNPCMIEETYGVWMDAFLSEEWITPELVKKYLGMDKQVCIVSPELHGRAYRDFWQEMKSWNIDSDDLLLCTDHPAEAKEFFYE